MSATGIFRGKVRNLAFNLLIDLLVVIYRAVEDISLWYIWVEEMVYMIICIFHF